ncbi:MAG: hypothetical protein A2283_04750 [Lentisphaerae bacterium RIFOXYA12_FULL_48_11]|nr:MAG: hypothetical protein A2283_04750 [Lentisphaerae bacterium RIFOXYA12_FULL_48_11]
MKQLERFSLGMGDRFAHEGKAQLQAIVEADKSGINLVPVWNKSNREHTIIKSRPDDVRVEANTAVQGLAWKGSYYVDADHIGLATVDNFISACDFFTLDVADFTGKSAPGSEIEQFVKEQGKYCGSLAIPGIPAPFEITDDLLHRAAAKFLLSIKEAGRIYRHIRERKGDNFVTEVSVDETDTPQSPIELFLILVMLAREGVPAQTIAPKFTGRFNKGVDYVGNLVQFEKEFDEDLAVISFAVRELGFPATLKLSVHSGSDKFSLYPIINRLTKKHKAGLHLKTAGTTWLEEVIGLAEAGGEGLLIAQEIYARAYPRAVELITPYAPVVDIDVSRLPAPDKVAKWSSSDFVATLRHDQSCAQYNQQFRQFIHVSFKIAAELGTRYTDALKKYSDVVARNVTGNLFSRHIMPLFR